MLPPDTQVGAWSPTRTCIGRATLGVGQDLSFFTEPVDRGAYIPLQTAGNQLYTRDSLWNGTMVTMSVALNDPATGAPLQVLAGAIVCYVRYMLQVSPLRIENGLPTGIQIQVGQSSVRFVDNVYFGAGIFIQVVNGTAAQTVVATVEVCVKPGCIFNSQPTAFAY